MANYLSDKPANFNSNKYPVHKRIADVIHEDISHGGQPNCRRIALVGEWGSGKSTIISMLQEKFQGERDVCFLQFDLWSHTGDSLRRSFLTKLNDGVKEGVDGSSLDPKVKADWDDLDSKIAFSEQTVLTIEKHDHSPIAIAILMVAFLYGALSVLFSGISSAINDSSNLFVILSPLGSVLLSILIAILFSVWMSKSGRFRKGAIKEELINLAGVIGGRPNTQSTRTTQTELLGSLSYESYLIKLLKLAKKALPNGRLVVVLDNLDRLTPDNARAAWDAIQVFANQMDVIDNERIDTWLILPVSVATIGTIEGSDSSGTGNGTLSKLFIVRHEIPSPIRSEWKKSVCEDLALAFPDSTPETQQFIFSVMNKFSGGIASRRPRDNKRVINEIVSLARVYRDIPLESIAIFVWHRDYYDHWEDHKVNQESGSVEGSFSKMPHREFVGYIANQISASSTLSKLPCPGKDIYKPEHLAMLAFGLFDEKSAEEAMLIVLLNDLDWIRELDLEKQLVRSPAFLDTLGSLIETSFSLDDPSSRHRFSVLLHRLFDAKLNGPSQIQSRASVATSFAAMLPHYPWPLEKEGGSIVGKLLKQYSDIVFVDDCLEGIKLASEGIGSFDNKAIKEWATEVAAFCSQATDCSSFNAKPLSIDFEGNLYAFIEAASSTCSPDEVLGLFSIVGEQATRNIVTGLVSSRPAAGGNVDVAKALSKISVFTDLSTEIDFANPGSLGLNNGELYKAFYIECWLISRFGSPNATAYIQENSTFNFSDVSNESSVPYIAAAVASYIQEGVVSNRSGNADFNIDELDDEVVRSVAELYLFGLGCESCGHDYISDVFDSPQASETLLRLSDSLADAVAAQPELLSRVPYTVFADWIATRKHDKCQAYATCVSNAYSSDELCEAPFIIDLSQMYIRLGNSDNGLHEWIFTGLNGVSIDDWKEDLFGGDLGLSQLAITINAAGGSLTGLDDAVQDRLGSLSTPDQFEAILALKKKGMLERLSDATLSEISYAIAMLFVSKDWKMQYAQLKNELMTIDWLSRLGSDQLKIVVLAIVESRTFSHAEWLNDALSACKKLDTVKTKCVSWSSELNRELSKRLKNDPKGLNEQFKMIKEKLI